MHILYICAYIYKYVCTELYLVACILHTVIFGSHNKHDDWRPLQGDKNRVAACSVRAHIVLPKVTVRALCCRHIVGWFSSQRDYGNQMDYGDGDNRSWYFPSQLLLLTVTELKTAAQKK